MVEIFATCRPIRLLRAYSFISANDLPDFKAILSAVDGGDASR